MNKSAALLVLFSCLNNVGFSQVKSVDGKKPPENINYRRAMDLAGSKPDSAIYYFEAYSKTVPVADSVVQKRSITFYNYVGSGYLHKYYSDSINNRLGFKKAFTLFEKVIEIDSANLKANVNLMIAHYNNGVRNIVHGDYCKQRWLIEHTDWNSLDSEIPSIQKLLECLKPEEYEKYQITPPFKSALPFALRVHRQDPANKQALEALQGIYAALGDQKQMEAYKVKFEKLQKG